ncbi:P2X purinoceptor 4-like isoform X2 [Anneissia japonica]|uniref:P2X purinoceptor 4-like isoform X2 n=1 Tax=Anneissia japonica TaxID=1529436 RepID=UPI0014255046|nr:P2X purinoceptor 4-like isoform X2 [Anneissia japonica]
MSSIKGFHTAASIWARAKIDSFLEYDTPKMVHINSWKAGATNRLIQLGIITYVVGYVIVWNHGYQDIEMVEGTATAKVKGTSFTNITNAPDLAIPVEKTDPYNRVWDVSDYVIPPQQTDAFFIMSNMVITPDQTQNYCPELPEIGKCKDDSECINKDRIGHGEYTGRCVMYNIKTNETACEIFSWCPVENDTSPRTDNPVIPDAENFTVLIRNSIAFPRFNFKKRNILKDDFKCSYDPLKSRFCPIFRIGKILNITGHPYNTVAKGGAIIIVDIQWDCNLDEPEENCVPKYRFTRSDVDESGANGFNFRWSYYYKINGTLYRTLTKAYGILFKIKISGQAGKFSVVPLMLNIGSGLALLSLATVMCDVVVLYVLKKRHLYKEVKYQNVSHNEEECEEIEIQKMSANHKGLESNDILLT